MRPLWFHVIRASCRWHFAPAEISFGIPEEFTHAVTTPPLLRIDADAIPAATSTAPTPAATMTSRLPFKSDLKMSPFGRFVSGSPPTGRTPLTFAARAFFQRHAAGCEDTARHAA